MLSEGGKTALDPTSLPTPDSTPEGVLRSAATIHAREKCQWLWHQSKAALRMVVAKA